MIKNFKKLFKRKTWLFQGENMYNFQYKISFPLNSGGYKETGLINVTVPANDLKEAKEKLDRFVKKKIKVTVVSVKELKS